MVSVPSDRQWLRTTFDSAAQLYQQARPDYPAALYDELIRLAGLRPPGRLLEIGCATGKATLPLAARGFRLTCLEMGPRLAAVARGNLARFPAVTVTEADFETWRPPPGEAFDLIFAATAWHWIDPATRYQRAWALLAPGGHLAFWEASHVFPVDGDPIFGDIQQLYQEIGEGLPPGAAQPRPGELPDSRAEIEASGLFQGVTVRQFDWAASYTAAEYLSLLSTFSGHIAMAQWQRDHLYDGIRRLLAGRPDGRLRRHWGVALHVARRPLIPAGQRRCLRRRADPGRG
jgi:SAM-dependent methyltransferase